MDKNKIKHIFQTRDKAVYRKDRNLFLSTQTWHKEIKSSFSKDYLRLSKMKSIVLHTTMEDSNQNKAVVFVKEIYHKKGKFSHEGYLIYKLVSDSSQCLIYDIRW